MFRYVVLGLLHSSSPQHGYALMKQYQARMGSVVSAGNFYRELQHLMAQGHVRTADRPENADPRRAPYAITASGRLKFEQWFLDPRPAATGDDDPIAPRLPFLFDVPAELAVRVTKKWRDDLWFAAKSLERDRATAELLTLDGATSSPALPLVLTRRIGRIASDLQFVEEIQNLLLARPARREIETQKAPPPRQKVRPRGGRRS